MTTKAELKQSIVDSQRFKSVSEPIEIPGHFSDIPGMSMWEIHCIEANGKKASAKTIRLAVYNEGQTEEAYYLDDGTGDIIKGNLEVLYYDVIVALWTKTGCKAWRSLEKNTERDYAVFKCLIEITAQTENSPGTGEWKKYTVYKQKDSSMQPVMDNSDPNNPKPIYHVLETSETSEHRRDVIQ